jgi:hypothetical protein
LALRVAWRRGARLELVSSQPAALLPLRLLLLLEEAGASN